MYKKDMDNHLDIMTYKGIFLHLLRTLFIVRYQKHNHTYDDYSTLTITVRVANIIFMIAIFHTLDKYFFVFFLTMNKFRKLVYFIAKVRVPL